MRPLPFSLRYPEPDASLALEDARMGDECPCDDCNPRNTDEENLDVND